MKVAQADQDELWKRGITKGERSAKNPEGDLQRSCIDSSDRELRRINIEVEAILGVVAIRSAAKTSTGILNITWAVSLCREVAISLSIGLCVGEPEVSQRGLRKGDS